MRGTCTWLAMVCIAGTLSSCAPAPSPRQAVETMPEKQFVSVEWTADPPAAGEQETGKLYVAKQVAQPPRINGVLDDPCWQEADVLTGFTKFRVEGDPLADVQTHARIAFSDDTLYVGLTCDEPNIAGLRAKATSDLGAVWYDDCVELWLDVNYERHHSYHILVNPMATVFDTQEWDDVLDDLRTGTKKVVYHDNPAWNSGCDAKAVKGTDAWTVEMAVPVASMGVREMIRGGRWGLNVARTRRSGGGRWLSTWTGVFVSPISRFGTLQLGKGNFDVRVLSRGSECEGGSHVELRVENLTDVARDLKVELKAISAGKTRERVKVKVPARETKMMKVPYRLDGVGQDYVLALDAWDAGTKEKVLSRRYEGTVPEVLGVSLTNPELYLGEQTEMDGGLVVRLGDADLPEAELIVEVINEGKQTIAAQRISGVRPKASMTFDIAELKKEGTYRLRVSLLGGDGEMIARKQAPFTLTESPF